MCGGPAQQCPRIQCEHRFPCPYTNHWSILRCTKSSDFPRPPTISSSSICVPFIILRSSYRLRLLDYIHLSHLHSSNPFVKYGRRPSIPLSDFSLFFVKPPLTPHPLQTQFPTGFEILIPLRVLPDRSKPNANRRTSRSQYLGFVSTSENTHDGCKIACSRDPR